MKLIMRDYLYFFLNNPIKKAAWVIKGEEGSDYFLSNCPKLEFYYNDIKHKHYDMYMIFQHEQYKSQFINDIELIRNREKGVINEKERHLLIGEYLGFPPKAVEYFAFEKYEIKDYVPVNIGISYHGLSFASYPETYNEDVKWLTNTYKLPLQSEKNIVYEVDLKEFAI